MAGRTVAKWTRVYVDGLDMSGYSRAVGAMGVTYDEADLTTFSDGVRGAQANLAKQPLGPLDVVLDNTTVVGSHTLLNGAGVMRTVTVALGDRAAPAQGVPCVCGQWEQKSYQEAEDGGAVTAHMEFEDTARETTGLNVYPSPIGWLLHPMTAETAANTAIGIDDYVGVPPTLKGGYMVYHAIASNAAGTVTIKVQHASVANSDANFADVAGLTSGALGFAAIAAGTAFGVVPVGLITVSRWLRWQIVLAGGMTTATFSLAFVRGL